MSKALVEIFSADNLLLCSVQLTEEIFTRSAGNGGLYIECGNGNSLVEQDGEASTYRVRVPNVLDITGPVRRSRIGFRIQDTRLIKGQLLELHFAKVYLGECSARLFNSNTFVQTCEMEEY